MNTHSPFFFVPPPTEVPDYVLYRQYEDAYLLPGNPSKQPKDTSRWISHPDAETALREAKRACYKHPGRWYGRSTIGDGDVAFLVYKDGKVIERHMVSREA